MASIELQAVTVTRGGVRVLDGVDLRVAAGERLALLGPTGSGKSTLLRTVAGVESEVTGRVLIGGRDVTRVTPARRDVAMVDQRTTLQPHLDTRGNLGFPLILRRTRREEFEARVAAEARVWSLDERLARRPSTLSVGERDEVALARSLVHRSRVLLLDEPFANHDVPRRAALLRELIRVQEGYGVTLVCASNDQRVAMQIAQRCAVLDGGRIVQVGTPTELLRQPTSLFVAGFVGTPPMNVLPARVERRGQGARIIAGPLRIRSFLPVLRDLAGQACSLGIRPRDLRRAGAEDVVVVEEPVRSVVFLGPDSEVRLGRTRDDLVATIGAPPPPVGALLRLAVDPHAVHVFAADGTVVSHGV